MRTRLELEKELKNKILGTVNVVISSYIGSSIKKTSRIPSSYPHSSLPSNKLFTVYVVLCLKDVQM